MPTDIAAKKICLVSLGCPKNLVDAEIMLGFLKKDGFAFTSNPEEAEVIVVNTCGFVEDSKKESIEELFRASEYKKTGKCELLVATGCLSERYHRELEQEMPEIDVLVGLGEFDRLAAILREKFYQTNQGPRSYMSQRRILPDPDLPRVQATPRHYSYLKISEGCSHRCSFCIIPAIRGGLQSRSIDSITQEVSQSLSQGVKEFNLVAQDLNEYGKDRRDGSDLVELWRRLDALDGDFWLRPHYMYPLEFGEKLVRTLADSAHFARYIDMPLQHINDRIMRSMRRGSPARYVRQLLDRLKKYMPDLTIRTTFIVGYPGETDAEFGELLEFVRQYEFDRVGVFEYSPEKGTAAFDLKDQVSARVKRARHAQLMEAQREVSLKKNRRLLGKTFKLLCEGPSQESEWVYQGRLSSQAPEIDGITYMGKSCPVGEFVWVKIVEAHDYDLVAEPLVERSRRVQC